MLSPNFDMAEKIEINLKSKLHFPMEKNLNSEKKKILKN